MEILITGGAGFIGSHISKQLLEQGHKVRIFDNLSRSTQDSIDPRATFIKGDLALENDQEKLTQSLKGVDAVIHMASLISVEESTQKPREFIENNILGSINLLETMKEQKTPKIIFSSSATVYGNSTNLPFKEDAPTWAANPYGATKIATEALLQSYQSLYNFDTIILRYFNPYGPGENHQPIETHAIPNILKNALLDKPITLYWKGEQKRDFIYVTDLAQAHIDVLGLSGYHVFNVGTENGVKIIDVVNKVEKILGKKLKIEDKGARPGDVAASYASSELLKNTTGWTPKVSLEDGLRKTLEALKETL